MRARLARQTRRNPVFGFRRVSFLRGAVQPVERRRQPGQMRFVPVAAIAQQEGLCCLKIHTPSFSICFARIIVYRQVLCIVYTLYSDDFKDTGAKIVTKKDGKAAGKKNSQLVLRLDKSERDAFVDLCKEMDTSAAREIRRFIREFMKENADR